MAEECKDPERDFPKMMLTGLGITGVIYVLVAITAVALVPVGRPDRHGEGSGADSRWSRRARPDLPIDTIFPFIGDVRGGQHRADQHADGQPAALRHGQPGRAARGRSARCTRAVVRRGCRSSSPPLLALGLIIYVVRASASEDGTVNVALLGGTTALLLLLRVHGGQHRLPGPAPRPRRPRPLPVARTSLPVVGALPARSSPARGRAPRTTAMQYKIARRSPGRRRRAVGDHLGHQPRGAAADDRLPRRRPPRVARGPVRPGRRRWPLVDPHRD